jgi:hypothetical protein
MSAQVSYIEKEMRNLDLCPLSIKPPSKIKKDIDTSQLKRILQKKYINAQEMQAISCLFQTIIIGNTETDNIPILGENVNKWIYNMKKLSEGAYGEVYMTDIIEKDVNVVIKVPLHTMDYGDALREYFIGVTKINMLRYYIPNFVYTLGAFKCGDINRGCNGSQKIHTIYEKINGQGLFYKIKNNDFDWFLNMYVHILLALEVAQREIGFSHYDLHTLNVMIKEEPIKYTVLLDNVSYDIDTYEYPVIIDFGRSCVDYNDKSIGVWGLEQLNIFPFSVQGIDLGNLLNSAYIYNTDMTFKNKILKLSQHMGIDIERLSISSHFNISPLNALLSIISHPEYGRIASRSLSIKQRDKYIPIQYETVQNVYNELFKQKGNTNKRLLNSCLQNPRIYSSYILANIVKNLSSHFDSDKVKNVNEEISKNKHRLIRNDLNSLRSYREISSISSEILTISRSLLSQDVSTIYAKVYFKPSRYIEIKNDISDFMKAYNNFIKILPYLDQIYIIHWQKLNNEYSSFLQEFFDSRQYREYIAYKGTMFNTIRWIRSLQEDLQMYH